MQTQEVTARVKANPSKDIPNDLSATFNLRVPESVEEAVESFGNAVVLDTFNDQYVVKAQARVRDLLLRGETPSGIQAYIDKWKLGERADAPVDMVAAIREKTKDMSPEEAVEYLQNLMRQSGKQVE